jgi:hypothetical protein
MEQTIKTDPRTVLIHSGAVKEFGLALPYCAADNVGSKEARMVADHEKYRTYRSSFWFKRFVKIRVIPSFRRPKVDNAVDSRVKTVSRRRFIQMKAISDGWNWEDKTRKR